MKLKGKTAVITGASRGLGRALALRFAAEGARLALCSRLLDEHTKARLVLDLQAAQLFVQACDISDPEQVKEFAKNVLREFGTIDVLINNAAILGPRTEIADYPSSMWDRVMLVNINGAFYVTKEFLQSMRKQGRGSIINVTSSVGRIGKARWGAYAVSKFGVEGLSQVLAEEVRHYGIRVNTVNPGAMATEMRHAAYPQEDQSKLKSPDDTTDVFVYLASDVSRSVTGKHFEAQQFSFNQKEIV